VQPFSFFTSYYRMINFLSCIKVLWIFFVNFNEF